MPSPRKRRIEDADSLKTPTKAVIKEESQLVFTPPNPNLDWAAESEQWFAREESVKAEIASQSQSQCGSQSHCDEKEYPELGQGDSGGPARRTRSRKPNTPQRANTTAKFEKALALQNALKLAGSDRIEKLNDEKRRNEHGSRPSSSRLSRSDGRPARKRNRSRESVVTDASTTPNRRSSKKNPRMDDSFNRTPRSERERSRSERSTSQDLNSPRPLETYVDPKIGWCSDEDTIRKRAAEIEIAKTKEVYQRYIKEVPLCARKKSDPRTPNKYLNYSRRNWDSQYRKWKCEMHKRVGEYDPSRSTNTSRAGSRASSRADSVPPTENPDVEATDVSNAIINSKQINFDLEHPDRMASLMGCFDLNTRGATLQGGGESTLKATENNVSANTPLDFSQMHSQR